MTLRDKNCLKILCGKEKMGVASISSFSHKFSKLPMSISCIYHRLLSANTFNLVESKMLFVSSLPNDKILAWTKFTAFVNYKITDSKIEICVGKSRKHCRKRRKCWFPSFSPFPTMFPKAFFS